MPAFDRFHSFRQLADWARPGRDYAIIVRPRSSRLAVVAPHGGGIEPGTSEVARAVCGHRFSLYCFDGLKERGNDRLHITSTRFDEPRCTELIRTVSVVVTVHACVDGGSIAYVGGLHGELKQAIVEALTGAGFKAVPDNTHHAGNSPRNLCNAGKTGKGVQLELSHGLRRRMFEGLSRASRRHTTEEFLAFTTTVRQVLIAYDRSRGA
jgi:phage replication-related protein YjqB (UPF0714/DUF867 family)